jgi:homoserine O-acetyltransferase
MNGMDAISPGTRRLVLDGPVFLEGGGKLEQVEVAYRSWGRLDPAGDNAVLVCHALTGSADADAWWAGLFGRRGALDPDSDFVVASNVLGGCYGTTGPLTPRPEGDGVHGARFPEVTIRDQVAVQARLLTALNVRKVRLVIGGSMGGMHALEWAVAPPLPLEAAVAVGAPARHSAWAVGLAEIQRSAVRSDPDWKAGLYPPGEGPRGGLAVARMVAMSSYRSPASFELRFGREQHPGGQFQVESYLAHQGQKLVDRFDANTYLTLTRAMDSHDLGRGRGGVKSALAGVRIPTLLVGIRTDVLYLPREIEELARGIPGSELAWIESPHGHDAFLIEQDQVSDLVRGFRNRVSGPAPSAAPEGRAGRCA